MPYGKPGAVRRGRPKRIGSVPRANCGPEGKTSQGEGEIKVPSWWVAASAKFQKSRLAMHMPCENYPKSEIVPDALTATLATLLVVDDNDAVLTAVVAVLRRAHFLVLSACNGVDAIELAKETKGRIDLLLSDVDMPLMSGLDLGLILKKIRPDLHVMLMSGGHNGNLLVLNYGWAFIQKPFMSAKLVRMITEVLHSPDRSQLVGQEFDSRMDTR
jgi:CheY-like chemotaxis protein